MKFDNKGRLIRSFVEKLDAMKYCLDRDYTEDFVYHMYDIMKYLESKNFEPTEIEDE